MNDNAPVLVEVKPLSDFHVHVKYSDGVEGEVDLSRFVGQTKFAQWDDYNQFEKVTIGPDGDLDWGDEIRLDGFEIYLKLTGKKTENA